MIDATSRPRVMAKLAAMTLLTLMILPEAVAQHPDVLRASQRMSTAVQQRNIKAAMTEANRIVQRRPQDPDALVLRAKLYMMMRQGPKALEDIQAALKIDPHHPGSTQIMAGQEYQQGKKKEANARVDAALKKHPNSVELIVLKADLKKAGGDAEGAMQLVAS